MRCHRKDRLIAWRKGSVHVIRNDYQVGISLDNFFELRQPFRCKRPGGRVSRVHRKEGLDPRILQFFKLFIGHLPVILPLSRDRLDPQVVFAQFRDLQVRGKDGRINNDRAFTPERLAKFKEVIKANPDLVIITDDVYGTFSPSYQSIFAVAPHNTILVYSFSKLYGATGQRLGVVCMHHQNVCDRIIQENLQNRRLKELDERRYSIVVPDPHKMKFIDRMVADSRAIGLYHTAGLSSPQQVMMDMFALSNLKDAGLSPYVQLSREVVAARYHEFWHGLGIQPDETPENTRYYTLVDIFDLMRQRHGKKFCQYFKDNYNYLDFTYRLATEFGAVVMDATAFGAEKGNVRVSLANLEKADYRKLARAILDLVDEYYQVFKKKNKK